MKGQGENVESSQEDTAAVQNQADSSGPAEIQMDLVYVLEDVNRIWGHFYLRTCKQSKWGKLLDLFFPEHELAEGRDDRMLFNYQGCEISNTSVGSTVGRWGDGCYSVCVRKSL